ncbi:hypothetical protein [Ensifer canadensis]
MTAPGLLVTFNAGPSMVKVGLFEIRDGKPSLRRQGHGRFPQQATCVSPDCNGRNAAVVSTEQSRIKAYVIPTDEEQIIAREALTFLSSN